MVAEGSWPRNEIKSRERYGSSQSSCQSDGADLSPANLSCPGVYDTTVLDICPMSCCFWLRSPTPRQCPQSLVAYETAMVVMLCRIAFVEVR